MRPSAEMAKAEGFPCCPGSVPRSPPFGNIDVANLNPAIGEGRDKSSSSTIHRNNAEPVRDGSLKFGILHGEKDDQNLTSVPPKI